MLKIKKQAKKEDVVEILLPDNKIMKHLGENEHKYSVLLGACNIKKKKLKKQ